MTAPGLLTLSEARAVAAEALAPSYIGRPGTFHVATYALADDEFFWLLAGAREWLVDHDPGFGTPDGMGVLVNRLSGAVTRVGYTAVRAIVDGMVEVGDWPDPAAVGND